MSESVGESQMSESVESVREVPEYMKRPNLQNLDEHGIFMDKTTYEEMDENLYYSIMNPNFERLDKNRKIDKLVKALYLER